MRKQIAERIGSENRTKSLNAMCWKSSLYGWIGRFMDSEDDALLCLLVPPSVLGLKKSDLTILRQHSRGISLSMWSHYIAILDRFRSISCLVPFFCVCGVPSYTMEHLVFSPHHPVSTFMWKIIEEMRAESFYDSENDWLGTIASHGQRLSTNRQTVLPHMGVSRDRSSFTQRTSIYHYTCKCHPIFYFPKQEDDSRWRPW